MECTLLEKYLGKHECHAAAVPGELQQHIAGCGDCRNYYRFVSALDLQNGSQEKAPEDILPAIEKRIYCCVRSKNKEPWSIFTPLLKPSFAVPGLVLVVIAAYVCIAHKNVGYVENLSERFKLAQFENIKSGDMLYTGDNTTAAIGLNGKNRLQIHQNTIVKVNGSRHLSLSRGEISLLAGDKELKITTPDGLLLARNTSVEIHVVARLKNGTLKTETTCMAFKGKLAIKSPIKEIILRQGQKAVIAENGRITDQQQLSAAESASKKSIAVKHKIVTAVESLCDCIFAVDYTPGKKTDHLEIFGKEANENRFKVRVFWQEKKLDELVFRPLARIIHKFSSRGAGLPVRSGLPQRDAPQEYLQYFADASSEDGPRWRAVQRRSRNIYE